MSEEGCPAGTEAEAQAKGVGWEQSASWEPSGYDVMLRVVQKGRERQAKVRAQRGPVSPSRSISGIWQQHVH